MEFVNNVVRFHYIAAAVIREGKNAESMSEWAKAGSPAPSQTGQ